MQLKGELQIQPNSELDPKWERWWEKSDSVPKVERYNYNAANVGDDSEIHVYKKSSIQ